MLRQLRSQSHRWFTFWPALREGRVLSPDDGVIFNIPLRVAAANLIRSGHLPLWNPYMFCGLPLHGAAQAGLLFPLNWFYVISSPRVATNLMMLSTYMVAAVGAYLYARRAGADIAGAIATSLIWQWCAFMVEQIGHTNIVHTAAVLPWLLWSCRRLSRHRRTQARISDRGAAGVTDFRRSSTDLRLFAAARLCLCPGDGANPAPSPKATWRSCNFHLGRIGAGSGADLTDVRVAAQQPQGQCYL